MTARIAIITATLLAVAPSANPHDLAALAVAVAQVERITALDVPTMLAVASVETGGTFRSDLVSRVGACGVLQSIPKWTRQDKRHRAMTCEELSQPLGGVVGGLLIWNAWAKIARRHPVYAHYNAGGDPGFKASSNAREHERRRRRIAGVMGER